ncbi:diguanylate cyclase (GGDEF)-like protein [Rhizobium sp. PP-F2F-G38]|nr:diguanylate cyclase (GGDEF)-like protein [Rhizobium sp. PP-F2F-G38]
MALPHTDNRRRRRAVLIVALLFILVASIFAGIVFRSVNAMKDTANRIDDERALDATTAAVDALRTQLFGILHDNATWDGAYKQLNSINRKYWITQNWANTSLENPAYDTAAVTNARGNVIVAYKDGKELTEPPEQFFGDHFTTIVRNADQLGEQAGIIPVYAVRSKSGVALMAAAKIRPTSSSTRIEERNLYTLVMARHLTTQVIGDLSQSFRIERLTLSLARADNMLNVPLTDIEGNSISYLSWPSKLPGSRSFLTVKTQLAVGAAILVIFLTGIAVAGWVAVRKLRQDEAAARHAALKDPLTGLWNRRALLEHLAKLTRNPHEGNVELCLLDLDGFKRVNDAWGHAVGDELIADVARRLQKDLPPTALLARLGGDEFAIVVTTGLDASVTEDVAELALSAACDIFHLGSRQIQVAGSIGRASARLTDISMDSLMRAADIALYSAKNLGRGRIVTFDSALEQSRRDDMMIEQYLRKTLETEGIEVFYQPLVRTIDQTICGVEALARWSSSPLGRVPPDVFIPIAEKAGLIDMLGLQVLRKAIQAATAWPDVGVCVNVSPVQLQDNGFANEVEAILTKAGTDPGRLTLEITEGVLISHPEQALKAITALKGLGVGVALDDFGTGFASIGMLRRFAFDRVKVDKSLVAALDTEQDAAAVLQATIALARAMGISVTVEGVETELQAGAASLYGCDIMQGYLYSKPMSEAEMMERYFTKWKSVSQ